jgi:hypothetical protein
VEKEVLGASRLDEPESLVRQFFDSTFGHFRASLIIVWIDIAQLTIAGLFAAH